MHCKRADGGKNILVIATGLALLAMAGCSHPVAVSEAPPAPVGHVYATAIQVPPPTYQRVKFTPAQREQLQQAFNIIALKSALMVGALSCAEQDKYDSFMRAFQPHILAEQHVMDRYFHQIDGRYGQGKEDTFVTLLANNQSVSGIANGPNFCLNNAAEFQAVLALKTPQELDAFATDKAPDDASMASNQP